LVGTPEGAEAQPEKNAIRGTKSREICGELRVVRVMTMQGIV
jgi:hypothetical protein